MSETTSCPTPSSCACAPASTSTPAAGAIQNGKGDAPRNISKRFRSNYDGIKWTSGGKKRQEGAKFVKAY